MDITNFILDNIQPIEEGKTVTLTCPFCHTRGKFTATVKDEGVDFNVAYVPSMEEKQAVEKQMREFVENDLDVNVIFAERWVNSDNTINVKQMTKDLFLLQNEGKITQKYINEAANKRLALHLKKQSNIDLNGTNSGGTFDPSNQQSEMDKLAAIMFAK